MEPDKSVAKLADVTAMLTSSVGQGMKVQLANATSDGITVLLVDAETGASIEFKQKWGSRSKALRAAVSRAPDILPPKPQGPPDVTAFQFRRVLRYGDHIYIYGGRSDTKAYAVFTMSAGQCTYAYRYMGRMYSHLRSVYTAMCVEYTDESIIDVVPKDSRRGKLTYTLAEFVAQAE